MSGPGWGHRAEAFFVRAGVALLQRLSPEAGSNLGGFLARAIGPLIPVSNVADRNLRLAMPELDKAARKKIIADCWENLGRTVAELVRIGDLHERPDGPGYTVHGWEENVAPALAKGGPAIFFTGHICNWEITPPAAFAHGADVAFMYRAASNSLVDKIILDLRQANFRREVKMFAKGAAGARAAYTHLARGGYLGIMVDQKLDNGIEAPFFGIPAMTAPAMASFALKMKCPVLPTYSVRTGPARLDVFFEAPLALPDTGDKEADILALTTEMNATLERWIRAHPGNWLWLHRRWPKAMYRG